MPSQSVSLRQGGLIALFLLGFLGLTLTGLLRLPIASNDARAVIVAQPITVAADAYVRSDAPTKNNRAGEKLRVDASPVLQSYLRFDVQGLTGRVTKATLSLFAASASKVGYDVRVVADTTWQEGTITFANAPAMDAAVVGSSGPFAQGQWTQVDVTSLVKGNGQYSFGLTTSTTVNMSLASRETSLAPRLVIETDISSVPPVGPEVPPVGPEVPPVGPEVPPVGPEVPPVGPEVPPVTPEVPPVTPGGPTAPPPPTTGDAQPSFPIRAAFYYPWFPEGWNQQGLNPFTRFTPSLGFYGDSSAVIREHIAAMANAGLTAGIASWWGQGSKSDSRFPSLLAASAASGSTFKWTIYYEPEGSNDPSTDQVRSDLTYIGTRYANDPAYLKVGGKPVIFVYNANDLTCAIVDKWNSANTNFYVNLKVFGGYRTCASQPDSWHQYVPAAAEDHQRGHSFAISPGFYKANEAEARLARDPARWATNVQNMIASNAPWQLVTTFNEWGEGSSVESATQWQSATGAGSYLDVLRSAIGAAPAPARHLLRPRRPPRHPRRAAIQSSPQRVISRAIL